MEDGTGNKNNVISTIAIVFLILAIGIALFFLFKNDAEEQFYLIGSKELIVSRDTIYSDPGFVAKDSKSNNANHEVLVDGTIDSSTCGEYQTTYTWKEKILTRNVTVYCPDEFTLNGNQHVYILLNGKYKEDGYIAYFNNKDYHDEVKITSNVNYKKSGAYTINYKIDSLNKSITRNIYIFDVNSYVEIDYDKTAAKEVTLDVEFDRNYISYYINPSNEKVNSTKSTYKVTKNGSYVFTFYDKYGNKATKKVEISNIDSQTLTASCTAKISSSKTQVTVKASSNATKYSYNNNNSTNNSYTFNSKVENVTVKVYDKYDDYITINCSKSYVSSKMEIHFIASDQADDAILIRTDDTTIMIDGGSIYTKKYVLNYLHNLGVTKIDAMIGSHMHSDHIQTQGYILEEFSVNQIYYPDDIFTCHNYGSCTTHDQEVILAAIKKYNKQPKILKAGDKIKVGDITIYVLAPWKIEKEQNINSLVFILKFENNTFMFTGDTGDSILSSSDLISYASKLGISLKVDFFKWPHHGTRSINTSFVNTIKPKYVAVPNIATGRPNSATATAFKNAGATIYEQLTYKNIVFISDGTNITVITNANASDYKR